MQASPASHLIENFHMEFAPISINLSDEIIELFMINYEGVMRMLSPMPMETTASESSDSFSEFYKLYNKKKQKLLENENQHQHQSHDTQD